MGDYSLRMLEHAATSRNDTAGLFMEVLGKLPGLEFQKVNHGNRSSYKDFSITIDQNRFGLSRDQLLLALAAENIDTRKYYDPPVHLQTAYQKYYDGLPLPNTDQLVQNSLSLPIWTNMDNSVAMKICDAIVKIHENAAVIRTV